MELVFASANLNKVKEVEQKMHGSVKLRGLTEIGCFDDIPETSDTLQGNAEMKAEYIWNNYKLDCFADDTGLEVDALNGAPGVYSARYAGPQKSPDDNIIKLLKELEHASDRRARFRTVICLILGGTRYFFEGKVEGRISETRMGQDGFGYDPVFIPDGESRSFAQMSLEEKNAISHRGKAIAMLEDFLRKKML